MDKRRIIGLVKGTLWNEFLELNRLAFADWLPRNGESRAIAYAMRFIKKTYPWIKWIVSFADGTQCGDGTIYRASGFYLTGIKINTQIWEAPSGKVFQSNSARGVSGVHRVKAQAQQEVLKTIKSNHVLETGASSMKIFKEAGWKPKEGFQLRYIYFLDPMAKDRLIVPILPYSEIERRGAGMYKGIKRGKQAIADDQSDSGGAAPTATLHNCGMKENT